MDISYYSQASFGINYRSCDIFIYSLSESDEKNSVIYPRFIDANHITISHGQENKSITEIYYDKFGHIEKYDNQSKAMVARQVRS